jgi:uncharacterized delta-60 repeat protein
MIKRRTMMKGRLRLSYILILILFFTLTVAAPLIASDIFTKEEWVARYTSPGNDSDEAIAIAVDASGNVYVTGRSYCSVTDYDYATVKYDTNGNQLWVARYNGPESGWDSANAIAVDASGNVYVTGRSYDSVTDYDYATVKYDTNGNQLWVARYNGPESGWDGANVIAVDALGNIIVTGETEGDYATVKYDTNGNQLWVARYNGQESNWDSAKAIAFDSLGNIYVTGESYYNETDYDYATVKYDTYGNQLWVARYNGPERVWDSTRAIIVDSLGNIYVTGESGGDYATVKYDTNGNQLWAARYNGTESGNDSAWDITVDSLGNIYVTGESYYSGTDYDYATVKYDTNGNQLWAARYNGPGNSKDSASAITVDSLGNICVTGESYYNESDYDYATVKYDTNGNQLWVARYNGPGNSKDSASAIAVDSLGNIYVTGESYYNETDYDYATVKYDTNGNQLWVARYNGPGDSNDRAGAIAVNLLGNVYVTGESEGDYATVKYDTNGNQLWVKLYNGPGSGNDAAQAIAVDASGNVYVTGGSYGIETWDDYATVKYDTNGNQLWVNRYNGPGSGNDRASSMAVDSSGNVYVTGVSRGSGTGDDFATVKYDTNGNQLWVKLYNGPLGSNDEASAMAVDVWGSVYVTGESRGSGTGDDFATVKYDTNGNQLWVNRYNGTVSGWDSAKTIAVDTSGNVYVTGGSYSETGSDYATVKYDTNGNQLWVNRYNGPGSGVDQANAIVIDASANVYVTGGSYGEGTWYDYATVKYDTRGNLLWVNRYNGPGNDSDEARSITVDLSGNVYVTGRSIGSGTWDDYTTLKYGNLTEVEVTMELPGGWSMISLPVRPEVATVATLFSGAIVMYRYQKETGYLRVREGENLEVGMGYWILLDNSQSYVISGTEITEYSVAVEDEWYLIGGCTSPAHKMVTNGRIDVIYGYTQGIGYTRLLESELLKPGKGYWILFSKTTEGSEFTPST